jgi:hypothetical protein
MKPSDWKAYEQEILEALLRAFPGTSITSNRHLEGRFSKTKRQIDILIEGDIAGHKFSIVVDAKFYSKKIDVKEVESFLGLLKDVGAHKGLMISQKGYSNAALHRAHHDEFDLEVDILNFDEIEYFQTDFALAYSDRHVIALKPPFGWVIHFAQTEGTPALAWLHQRGTTIDKAVKAGEFMYLNFWDRTLENEGIEDAMRSHEDFIRDEFPNMIVEREDVSRVDGRRSILRTLWYSKDELPEHSIYVEFENFVFYCVLISPPLAEARNVRKLKSVAEMVKPGIVTRSPSLT